jgi:hypothetical protein
LKNSGIPLVEALHKHLPELPEEFFLTVCRLMLQQQKNADHKFFI